MDDKMDNDPVLLLLSKIRQMTDEVMDLIEAERAEIEMRKNNEQQ